MSKLMCFAGVSKVNGVLKFRGAQSAARITQLRKLGDTDVEMRFLEKEMTKSEAAKQLLAMNFANGRADIEALLVSVATDDNPFAKPKARTVKVKAKGLKISKAASEADDVPMSAKEARKIRAQFNARVKEAYEAN
jgi:hypothetical protein